MICVHEAILEQIDRAIEASCDALTQDIKKLISIKSFKGPSFPGAPFGLGPRAMLDTVMEMGITEGFYTTDYETGIVSLALKEGQPDLGIWLHGDVVPEGQGWLWPPFDASEYKGCIIGRGATDNKGQLCAVFHLLKIFKALGVELNYNPALYVGSDEENGMHDLTGIPGNKDAQGFCNVCTPPRLSLVPDSSFPVGYGGKGAMTATFRSKTPLKGLQITAGQEHTPGKAMATVYGKTFIANSPPRHAANPDPNGNMITMLMDRLLELEEVAEENRQVLEFFKMVSLDIHGEQFGINVKTDNMKPLTVFAKNINTIDGYPDLTVNIRYPIEITFGDIVKHLTAVGEEYGMALVDAQSIVKPYLLDPQNPVVAKLTEIANEITGEEKTAYTLSGATYAHVLPNALVFGMDGCDKPEGFPTGHGGAHGKDELVSLERLKRAMKIYARALLALNDMEW